VFASGEGYPASGSCSPRVQFDAQAYKECVYISAETKLGALPLDMAPGWNNDGDPVLIELRLEEFF
jgi:hypothetical protein